MTQTVKELFFDRLAEGKVSTSSDPAEIFPDWQGSDERWLFLAPHDDDIIIGAGLSFVSAIALGVETYAAITSDGAMGYCRPEHRESISSIRRSEARTSFTAVGLPEDRLFFLDYPDSNFHLHLGRRFAVEGDPHIVAGGTGLQNSYTWLLRKIRPTRLFLASITDIHPDHRATTTEMTISIFHAVGGIWPELGPALESLPQLYEFATYSDFLTPPTLRIRASESLLQKKLDGITAYRSQEQIGLVVEAQRKAGPKEFLREVRFDIFQPELCNALFDAALTPKR